MLQQKQAVTAGVVKYINGNRALVEIIKQHEEGCKSCGVCLGVENKPGMLEVNTIPGLNVGHVVTLQTSRNSPYKSILLIFVLPLINLLAGSLIGQKIHLPYPNSPDVRMLLFGMAFFLLTILVVSVYEKKMKQKQQPCKIISLCATD
jgi:positive regulator of sigma E activity